MRLFKYLQIILTILFIFGIIYFLRHLDYMAVIALFVKSNKWLFMLAVLTYFLSLLFKIIRLKIISSYYSHPLKLSYAATMQLVAISLAIMTPGRVGEFSKIFMLKKNNMPLSKSISLIIFERLFDMAFLGFFSFIFAAVIIKNTKLTILLSVFTAACILGVIFIKKILILSKLCPNKYKKLLQELKNLELNNNSYIFALIAMLTILTWIVDAMLQWLFAWSIGIELNLFLVLGVLCLSNIVAIFSILPAGIGTMDLSVLFLYSLLGLSTEASASILIVERFFGLVSPFVFALIMIRVTGLDFKELRIESENIALSQKKS